MTRRHRPNPAVRLLLTVPVAFALSCTGSARDEPPDSLTVMTYNVHYGDPDLEAMAQVICASGADVVGLQEVDVHWGERSAFADQASDLAQACGMEYRFGPIYSLPPMEEGMPPREFGVALLSRLPIVAGENHPLTRLSTQSEAGPQPMPGFLGVTVDAAGTAVRVFVTHLDFRPDPAVREAQVAEMLAILGPLDRPTILLGDLNATPESAELGPLFQALRDAWDSGEGEGFTFPAEAPVRRIDYVLVGGGIEAVRARVLDTMASDHRPVLAELTLPRPRP